MKLELETKHCKRNTIIKNKFDRNTTGICGSIFVFPVFTKHGCCRRWDFSKI